MPWLLPLSFPFSLPGIRTRCLEEQCLYTLGANLRAKEQCEVPPHPGWQISHTPYSVQGTPLPGRLPDKMPASICMCVYFSLPPVGLFALGKGIYCNMCFFTFCLQFFFPLLEHKISEGRTVSYLSLYPQGLTHSQGSTKTC